MRRVVNGLAAGAVAGGLAVALLHVAGVDVAALAAPRVADYAVTETTGTIVPGTGDVGNHCDNCVTTLPLPFAYRLYDLTFTTTRVSDNGTLQFLSSNPSGSNTALPNSGFQYTIYPYWDNLDTIVTGTGIFTSVSGVAPNRILNVEWRARELNTVSSPTANFEVRLFEGQSRFDLIYGSTGSQGGGATIGVQRDAFSQATQYSFNQPTATSGKQLIFTLAPTAVVVRALSATAVRSGILLRWRTAAEADVLGFSVWRVGVDGKMRRLNRALLPARGGAGAARYSFLDRAARAGRTYRYRLQVVQLSGASAWTGLVFARATSGAR